MSWDFETDPEYQAELEWADTFVREEVEPVDMVIAEVHQVTLAREVLKAHRGTSELFPTGHLLRRQAEARERFADVLAAAGR